MENYEEKYKDALKKAKQFHDKDLFAECNGNLVEYIFPELKETGDEKVRKWLIDTIKSVSDDSIEWDVIDKSDVLAWLEKQCEPEKQKAEIFSGWIARDKHNERLFLYNVKPKRSEIVWNAADDGINEIPKELFPDLKWEDEPIEVDVIFKPKTT